MPRALFSTMSKSSATRKHKNRKGSPSSTRRTRRRWPPSSAVSTAHLLKTASCGPTRHSLPSPASSRFQGPRLEAPDILQHRIQHRPRTSIRRANATAAVESAAERSTSARIRTTRDHTARSPKNSPKYYSPPMTVAERLPSRRPFLSLLSLKHSFTLLFHSSGHSIPFGDILKSLYVA